MDEKLIISGVTFLITFDYSTDTGATYYAEAEGGSKTLRFFGSGHDLDMIKEEIEEGVDEFLQEVREMEAVYRDEI